MQVERRSCVCSVGKVYKYKHLLVESSVCMYICTSTVGICPSAGCGVFVTSQFHDWVCPAPRLHHSPAASSSDIAHPGKFPSTYPQLHITTGTLTVLFMYTSCTSALRTEYTNANGYVGTYYVQCQIWEISIGKLRELESGGP